MKQSLRTAGNATGVQVTQPPRILHVTSWPGPPLYGGNLNRWNFLKRITTRNPSRFVILGNPSQRGSISGTALQKIGIDHEGVDVLELPDITMWGRLRGTLESRIPPGVAFVERTIGRAIKNLTESTALSWHPDCLLLWNSDPAAILGSMSGVRKVLYACDSMTLFHRSVSLNSSNPFRKVYHGMVARRYARWERRVYPRYDTTVFVSKKDADFLKLGPKVDVRVIPNGVDMAMFKGGQPPDDTVRPRLLFHGSLSYLPNQAAARFIRQAVGPRLERQFGTDGFEIRILGGRASPGLVADLSDVSWLKLLGYVDDLTSELAAGHVYLAPLSMGSGLKNKILEAMSCGLTVVGTEEAFSGLDVVPGTHVIQCALHQVAHEAIALLNDPEKRNSIGTAARQWTVENADWDMLAARFERLLREKCDDDTGSERSNQDLSGNDTERAGARIGCRRSCPGYSG